MYTILIAAGIALLAAASGVLTGIWGWVGAIFIALLVFAIVWVLAARRLMRTLQPRFDRVRKQAEAGQADAAMQSLEELLAMGPWMPGLTGQIHAQLGTLALHNGNEKKAREHLARSSRRSAEGQLVLASLHQRNGDTKAALDVLARAAPFNKSHGLFHNVYAYLLHKADRVDEAIAQLNRLLKKAPDHAIGKDNLLRLQNGQKMDLKPFGREWFALGLERPPASMGELRTARKGFRQAPKQSKSGKPARASRSKPKKRRKG